MRLRLAFLAFLLALLVPGSAHAANLFVLSGADNTDPTTQASSIPGLISLQDGGGESQSSSSGGAVIAGTGVGPIVYNSGGGGSIRQFAGGSYSTLATGVPSVSSMTMTGRGLVVAIGNKLQYVSGGSRTDVPHGTLAGGDAWVAIATAPNGHLIGWSHNEGWGELWDLNLASGETTSQDYSGVTNSPLFNGRDNGGVGPGPVANAGDLAVDGLGGLWVAGVGLNGSNAQIYHAPPNGSLSSVGSGYHKPHITATGDGKAYASTSDYELSPYLSDVYKFSPSESKVTSVAGKLTNSAIFDLAVDRCYTSCTVSGPDIPGGGSGPPATGGGSKGTPSTGSTGKAASPLSVTPTAASVTGKGLAFKLRCTAACDVSVSGSLVYGKASSSASTKLRTTKLKLKAGRTTTVVLKLSKGQRKAIKKAKKKKRKVTAKLKVTVKPRGGRTATRSLKLKVR